LRLAIATAINKLLTSTKSNVKMKTRVVIFEGAAMRKTLACSILASMSFAMAGPAAAMVTADSVPYRVTYDNTTMLGAISFNSSSSDGAVSFGWNFPNASVTSTSGKTEGHMQLPDFTITPNPGYVVSGAVNGFFGNFSYVEFNGGTTYAQVMGNWAVDGGSGPLSLVLTKSPTDTYAGTYSGTLVAPLGSFNSFSMFGAQLDAWAKTEPGGFANISAQPQILFEVSFIAAAVPEPQSYMLMLSGLGFIGTMVWSRKRRSASLRRI
jgi:hypothetical protein